MGAEAESHIAFQAEPIPGLPVVFEDDTLLVVDKPSGMLSQPGKQIRDSVLTRVLQARPSCTGPVLVHRLDMDTSGLLLLGKTRDAHRQLQQQFERRRIGKRYLARLVARPGAIGGRIHLPLRVDLDDRPRQRICFEHGKWATTLWHVCERLGPHHVWLYPQTGRTHQLRVHMAHPDGLGLPVLGDRLYETHFQTGADRQHRAQGTGQGASRLMLHAQWLAFDHPSNGQRYCFQSFPDFVKVR